MKILLDDVKYLADALARLQEILLLDDNNIAKEDACVKRFEFTYEQCKKALTSTLNELGFLMESPREMFRKAHQQGFITRLELWDQMREDRNDSSHEYDKYQAAEIYGRIPVYAQEFKFVLGKVKEIQ